MKTRKVTRYYCDHCKKSGGSAYHMRRHEAGCTANPDRVCGMCAASGERHSPAVADMIANLAPHVRHDVIDEIDADALRIECQGCPACALAVVRQAGWIITGEWSWEAERKAFWKSVNEAREGYLPGPTGTIFGSD